MNISSNQHIPQLQHIKKYSSNETNAVRVIECDHNQIIRLKLLQNNYNKSIVYQS